MPDPSYDVAVANRFISSLSKSLQALCHGCMDFDSGIEIVGYINVNIDCGSKVDYVLNEKVSKSTNNSMTFVSNSFLAKKDTPKQTRDGACSPILHFGGQSHQASPYHHRVRGFSHGSWSRSAYHSAHFHRGAQKRGLGGDGRGAAKRSRPMPSNAAQFSSSMSTQGLPSETFDSGSFKHQQYQQHSDIVGANQGSENESSAVNIKKETFEGNDEAQIGSEGSEQQTNFDSSNLGCVNIKSDPDGKSDNVTDGASITDTQAENLETNDFKGTFLQPTAQDNQDNSDKGQTSESGDQSVSEQPVGFETPFPNPDFPSVSGEDETSNGAHEMSESNPVIGGEESESKNANSAAVEYDTAAEEASYSDYPEGGEGSSSGQFEVIEIDDEDEDMQAMFGGSHTFGHHSNHLMPGSSDHDSLTETPRFANQAPANEHMVGSTNSKRFKCNYCPTICLSQTHLHSHISIKHGANSLYTCSLCGKGYRSSTGLALHLQVHEGRSFPCPLCDTRFSQKGKIKRHLQNIHKANQCSTCSGIFLQGEEYNKHVLACGRNQYPE